MLAFHKLRRGYPPTMICGESSDDCQHIFSIWRGANRARRKQRWVLTSNRGSSARSVCWLVQTELSLER